MHAAFHQHTLFCGASQSRHDADRSGDDKRARARDDEKNQGAIEPYVPCSAKYKRRNDEHRHRKPHDAGRIDSGKAFDPLLGRRAATLRGAHHFDDTGERGVLRSLCSFDFQRTFAIDGSGVDHRTFRY